MHPRRFGFQGSHQDLYLVSRDAMFVARELKKFREVRCTRAVTQELIKGGTTPYCTAR